MNIVNNIIDNEIRNKKKKTLDVLLFDVSIENHPKTVQSKLHCKKKKIIIIYILIIIVVIFVR